MPVGVVGGALARRTSGRDFRPSAAVGGAEETLIETHAEAENDYSSGATERGTWGKGLARQSSLPSRRRESFCLFPRHVCASTLTLSICLDLIHISHPSMTAPQ